MEKREIWSARVREWRASGMSMTAFCRGKEFSTSNLSYWARQSDSGPVRRSQPVRLARVVRTQHAVEVKPASATVVSDERWLVIECGELRVQVPDALECGRLETVLVAVRRAAKAGGA